MCESAPPSRVGILALPRGCWHVWPCGGGDSQGQLPAEHALPRTRLDDSSNAHSRPSKQSRARWEPSSGPALAASTPVNQSSPSPAAIGFHVMFIKLSQL